MAVQFVVEQAGCTSCAERIRVALGAIGTVEQLDIDEASDVATVRLEYGGVTEDVEHALLLASQGSGHAYRVRPDSWTSVLA